MSERTTARQRREIRGERLMTEWQQYQPLFHELYGVELPYSCWQLHAFFESLDPKQQDSCFESLGMSLTGPLQLLRRPVNELALWKPKQSPLLHWRFYRDPPEFFTCLHGDTDGLHWGLLLDVPQRGFKGAASYYNNDADWIQTYASLFDVVLCRISDRIEGNEELCEYDRNEETYYRRQISMLDDLKKQLHAYIRAENILLDECRGEGLETDTGLAAIVPGGEYDDRWKIMDPTTGRMIVKPLLDNVVTLAWDEAERANGYPTLSVGRSLWYWGGKFESDRACQLLRRSYQILDRQALLRILEIHHASRDLPNVDLLEQ